MANSGLGDYLLGTWPLGQGLLEIAQKPLRPRWLVTVTIGGTPRKYSSEDIDNAP